MTRDLVHLRGDPIGVRLFPLLNPQQQIVDLRVARRFATLECGVEYRELRICELAGEVENLGGVAPNAELAVSVFGRVSASGASPVQRAQLRAKLLPSRRFRAIPFRVRENAEDVLDEIRSDIRRGIPPTAAIAPYVQKARLHSVERWWKKWVEYQTARAEAGQITAERWRKLDAHLSTGHLNAIRTTPIHQIDYAALQDLQRSLFDLKLAPKSVRHVMADVRTFLGWLEDRKLIQAIPKIPKINVPRHIPDIPSPVQQEAILSAIPWEHRGFFLARGYMGMRPREAVRARTEDYRTRVRRRWLRGLSADPSEGGSGSSCACRSRSCAMGSRVPTGARGSGHLAVSRPYWQTLG